MFKNIPQCIDLEFPGTLSQRKHNYDFDCVNHRNSSQNCIVRMKEYLCQVLFTIHVNVNVDFDDYCNTSMIFIVTFDNCNCDRFIFNRLNAIISMPNQVKMNANIKSLGF